MNMSVNEQLIDNTLKYIKKCELDFRCYLFLFWNEQRLEDVEVSFPKQKIYDFFEICGGTMLDVAGGTCIAFGSPILMLACRREMKRDLSWGFEIGIDTALKLGLKARTPIADAVIVFIPCNGGPEIEIIDFFLLN
jgi:hypothetical protein